MNTTRLKWLAIILPILFWVIVLELRSLLLAEGRSLAGDIFTVAMIALGSTIFSLWVFGIVEKHAAEVRRHTEQLDALREAALVLTTELDLGTVLQRVVDLSRMLVDSRYGALGVLDEDGRYIEQFITSGITPQQRALLGDPPRGHGLLGVLIKEGKPIRIPDMAQDSRVAGFPPHHPPMHSLLGVPIKSKGKVIGDLYMTDKIPDKHDDPMEHVIFTERDQQVLELFAAQAAVAIENAQLYRQTQQLAILRERERIGMDLHDGIIQSIYAIGLTLEDGQYHITTEPQVANERITQAIHSLNDVNRDIRNYILDLRPQRFQGRNLKSGLEELVHDLRANTFLTIHLQAEEADAIPLSPEQAVAVLHIAQEALTNVRKHARASRVDVSACHTTGQLVLTIADDGVGFDAAKAEKVSGYGLQNMRERARALGGTLEIEPRSTRGTRVTLVLSSSAGECAP